MRHLKRPALLGLLLLACLLLAGCQMDSTVEELFTLPRLPTEYTTLSRQLDQLLSEGYEYMAPTSGRNIQSLQMVDIDGDGRDEALAFFRLSNGEKPLKIYVFHPREDSYELASIIESSGTAIDSIYYEDLTGDGRKELIVGWKISSDVQTVTVYDMRPGPVQLMQSTYTRLSFQELNGDGIPSLLLLRTNSDNQPVAEFCSWQEGALSVSHRCTLSSTMAELSQQGRVKSGVLQDGTPALFVTGVEESAWMVTDILTVKNGELVNILLSDVTGVSSEIAPFSSLYPEDINGDGITEVPHPEPIPDWGNVGGDPCRRIDWYTYTSDGTKAAVVSTYHSVEDGWYLRLPDVWKDQILITRTAGTEEVTVTFSYRGDSGEPPQDVLRITKLTGSGREARATRGGRVILGRLPEIIYTAELLDAKGSWEYGLTEDEVREAFSLITTEWSAGDS